MITNGDDCSHAGAIKDPKPQPEACFLPRQETRQDAQGKTIIKRGYLEDLVPIERYIAFFKNKGAVLGGFIGDTLFEAHPHKCEDQSGCTELGPGAICEHKHPKEKYCGGCLKTRPDGSSWRARPAFRLASIIDHKGSGLTGSICDPKAPWVPPFASFGMSDSSYVPLTRKPSMDPPPSVILVDPRRNKRTPLPRAKPLGRCTDACPNKCEGTRYWGDGWVWISAQRQDRIVIWGKTKKQILPGTRIEVSYRTQAQ